MAVSSPQNPNVCAACEQLLADDHAELEKLIATESDTENPDHLHATAERPPNEHHEIFSHSG